MVTGAFNQMLISIRQYLESLRESMEIRRSLMEKELLMEAHLKDAQLKYLQAQINPHFLFNTLNAGAQLAMMEGADRTYEYVQNVAEFFRYNVKKSNDIVTVREELELVDHYIYILNVRFSGDIHYGKEIEEDLLDSCMPSMILQPIVENSIYHGLERKIGTGHLDIKVTVTDSHLIIMISDDGVGIEKGQVKVMNEQLRALRLEEENNGETGKKGGIAVKNVNNRIKLLFGEEYGIYIYSQPDVGTDVEITLPVVRN